MIADRDDAADGGPATADAFEWSESRYDTRMALVRAKQLRDGGTMIFGVSCRPGAISISARVIGCPLPVPWPMLVDACWNGGKMPGSARAEKRSFSWRHGIRYRGFSTIVPSWMISFLPRFTRGRG